MQQYALTLPADFVCDECIMQIERAAEDMGPGKITVLELNITLIHLRLLVLVMRRRANCTQSLLLSAISTGCADAQLR